jgi:hypothetical protein
MEAMFGHARVKDSNAGQSFSNCAPREYEFRQEERSGVRTKDVQNELADLWHRSGNGADFCRNLELSGYRLARGDRRVYVVIDRAGNAHSLSRRLGVGGQAIQAKLQDVQLVTLPSVTEESVRNHAAKRRTRFQHRFANKTGTTQNYASVVTPLIPLPRKPIVAGSAYRSKRAILLADYAGKLALAFRIEEPDRRDAEVDAICAEREAALATLNATHPGKLMKEVRHRLNRRRRRRRSSSIVRGISKERDR